MAGARIRSVTGCSRGPISDGLRFIDSQLRKSETGATDALLQFALGLSGVCCLFGQLVEREFPGSFDVPSPL
jgi:hypothetical protein